MRSHLPPSRRLALQLGVGGCLLGLLPLRNGLPFGAHTTSWRARRAVDPRAVNAVHTSARQVALTFDDGPDPQYTPAVLDVLAAFGVTATFFLIGRNALAHPDLVRRIAAAGHEIANHTQDHLWLDSIALPVVARQIRDAETSLRATGGRPGQLFRPPRGWTSPGVAAVTLAEGLRSVYWTDCLESHLPAGPSAAADRVARRANPGSILLCHDGGRLAGPNQQAHDRSGTVAALPELVAGLLRRGLTPVPVATLLRA